MIELGIYAIIAVLIFTKLYNELGKESNVVHKIIDVSAVDIETKEDVLDYVDERTLNEVKEVLYKIKKIEPGFSLDDFMSGANKSLEYVISQVTNDNLDSISGFIDKEVMSKFVSKIESLKEKNLQDKSILVSILSSKLTKLELIENTVQAYVTFTSEQIFCIKNEQGEVVKGNASKIIKVEDHWGFARHLNQKSSRSPWTIHTIS